MNNPTRLSIPSITSSKEEYSLKPKRKWIQRRSQIEQNSSLVLEKSSFRYFTEIPDGLQLQPQLSTFEFEQYMMKVLVSDQAMNYLVLPILGRGIDSTDDKELLQEQ
jgi:hypothetical protein